MREEQRKERLETRQDRQRAEVRGRGGGGGRLGRRQRTRLHPLPPPGYRSSVTMVQKGCWTGPPTGQMQSNEDALPPDYSVFQGCSTDLCNADLLSHYALPNLSPGVLEGGDERGGGAGAQKGVASAGHLLPSC